MAQASLSRSVGTAVLIGVVSTLIVQSILNRLPNLQAAVFGRPPPAGT